MRHLPRFFPHRVRSAASLLPLVLLFVLVLLASLPSLTHAAVPLTPNFRFDGQHSDFAQQFYRRHLAGDVAPKLTQISNDDVPPRIKSQLNQLGLYWVDLPGLLQRALLWDAGFALSLDNKVTRIYTRCGRSMAQIFVTRKAYQRIGCTPKACSVGTGELFYRHKWCDGDQAATISLCAAENTDVSTHSGMWGDGADADLVPDVNLVRHAWTDHNDSYLMFALHTVRDDAAYNFCPKRPTPVIPCAPFQLDPDRRKWCDPVRGPVVAAWLQQLASVNRSAIGTFTWIMTEFIFVLMLAGSTIFGTCNYLESKRTRHLREIEFEGLRVALLHRRRGTQRRYKDSDLTTARDTEEEDPVEQLERALDAAAFEYFDSSIGVLASAHVDADPRDLFSSRSSSLAMSLVRHDSVVSAADSASSFSETGLGSGGLSARGLLGFGGVSGVHLNRFERSVSTSSAISLLSGRRSQVAIRSFHLFESHSLILRKRVAFRDIQFRELLSQGTTGEVWRASLRGQDVAVKQLLPTKRRVLKEMELFMAEVYLLSQLVHPNIVSLVGVAWNTLEHVVMVQEWMQRGDLQRFLKRQHKSIAPPRMSMDSQPELEDDRLVDVDNADFTWSNHKLEIALSIARALAYMHSLTPQLLHRDVKSKNVLLSEAMEVKLCDFGISRRKHHMDEDDTNLTVTEAAGTMSWTAPEVLLGEDYGEKVDIYSYGILLCEVDTCVLPYHDASSLASRLIFHPLRLMRMVIGQGLRPAISPECPPKIASLIHACLDRDPQKRPDACEIAAYLSSDDIV